MPGPSGRVSGKAKILKNPLIYFFVLGFVVFGLHALLNMESDTPVEDPFLVEVTSADIEWLRASWESRMQRSPTGDELRGLIANHVREEILAREAHAMGLDEQDMVIKRRLVQKLTFVVEDLAESAEPSDQELRGYVEQNQERYVIPEAISFAHVYFNPDKRPDVAADASALLNRLRAGDTSAEAVGSLGDPIMLDTSHDRMPPQGVARAFGPEFAVSLFALEGVGWQGPIASTFGLHLVRVDARVEARMPDFENLRERVRSDFMYARKNEVIDATYESIRPRYTILVEGLPYE